MPDSLFTFDALATLAGASLLTYLVVQYTKALVDRVLSLPTDLYAVFIGALVLAQLATGADPADWRVYVLSVANGFLVAATAGKLNDAALKPPKPKPSVDDSEAGM
ncbi:MAG: hypothetical protein H0Z35_09310 [Thermoanaerobacteraceae bacterium]|nr:hypothetical protein [Thermoanaerobacteraceae bacterium]